MLMEKTFEAVDGTKITVVPGTLDDPDLARAKALLTEHGYKITKDNMSPREESVQSLVAEGYSNKQVANMLGITEATVKVHLKSIMRRHNVNNRIQLAVLLKTGKRPASAPL